MAHAQTQDEAAVSGVLHHLGRGRAQGRFAQVDIDDPGADRDALGDTGHGVGAHQGVVGGFGDENAAEAGVFDLARELKELRIRNS
jgi:hypothetical protein